jgi:hypothetical protein
MERIPIVTKKFPPEAIAKMARWQRILLSVAKLRLIRGMSRGQRKKISMLIE